MSTVNKTPILKLPQYLDTDIFDLKEINDAYNKIDKQYEEIFVLNGSVNTNENERKANYEQFKIELASAKSDLINTNLSIGAEEAKRVQTEVLRESRANSTNEKLESTNTRVTATESRILSEFNTIKTSNTELKNTLISTNSTVNLSEETRKTNEAGRVTAEEVRATEFAQMKNENESFKQGVNTSFREFTNQQVNNFETLKTEVVGDIEASYVGYDGEVHKSLEDRLQKYFDNIEQKHNDSTLLPYEGTSITANNSYYGLQKDTVLKGKTLQNLKTKFINEKVGYETLSDGYRKLTVTNVNAGTWVQDKDQINTMLKPNTKYIVITHIRKNTFTTPFRVVGSIANSQFQTSSTNIASGATGYFVDQLMAKEDFTSASSCLFCQNGSIGNLEGESIEYRVMLLEGDHTNVPLSDIPYIEGIQSVGEAEVNEDGKYILSGKSCAKNLINLGNIDRVITGNRDSNIGSWGETVYYKNIDISRLKGIHTVKAKQLINGVETTCKFILSRDRVLETDTSHSNVYSRTAGKGTEYGKELNSEFNYDFTNYNYLHLTTSNAPSQGLSSLQISISDIQLEEATTATPYEPYQESTYNVLSPIPLRSLPNGTADTYDMETGVLTQRVGKIVLDDSVVFNFSTVKFTNNARTWASIKTIKSGSSLYCDKFPSYSYSIIETRDAEGIGVKISSGAVDLGINIARSKLKTQDANGFKQWLQANPTTVYYELKEPVIHQLEPNQLYSYEGTTHVMSDNYLPPTTSTKIPSNVQAVVMDLKNENEALNNELEDTKQELETSVHALNDMDSDLVATSWDMDFRMCEVEWYLEDMVGGAMAMSLDTENRNNNTKGVNNMALTRYEQAKIMILGGKYDKEVLTRQLTTYLNRKYLTQEEYDELIALMEAREMVEAN